MCILVQLRIGALVLMFMIYGYVNTYAYCTFPQYRYTVYAKVKICFDRSLLMVSVAVGTIVDVVSSTRHEQGCSVDVSQCNA